MVDVFLKSSSPTVASHTLVHSLSETQNECLFFVHVVKVLSIFLEFNSPPKEPTMYQWTTFFLMLPFCSLGELQEAVPACLENDEFTLNGSIRSQLYDRISKLQPSLKYDCDLELMGGFVFNEPKKNMEFLKYKKVLLFNVFGQNGANLERAIRLYTVYHRRAIKKLEKKEYFGCNYINADDKHQFICIFE
ncbi:hypothetical protein NECAME_17038 [Necator americanus]|uniref:Uncharacterized protein n=1 Tax=Necator americanus TaxID=51031 RepID=W2TRK2_NECAM|nr:hypothetical protein NECAME_17038 [Necator americanus]ETN84690.1 hypothetical protein NECAME_17038 [Necator americanus]